MNTINKEGVIYTRVSTNKQANDGNGLEGQYSACLRYAVENNINVIKTIVDPGYSGKSSERPGIEELYNFLDSRTREIYVIAYDINRYSRSAKNYQYFKDDLAAKGGILSSPNHDFTNKDPANIFLEQIKIGLAEFERLSSNIRVNSMMRERVRAGYWVFRPPVGMLFEDKILIPDNINSPLIKKIYEDFGNGKYSSYAAVKKSKEARLLKNLKTNNPYQLGNSFIKKMLTNKLYTGVMEYNRWDIKEVDSPNKAFIDMHLFQAVQSRINKKPKRAYSVINQNDFPLKGNLECGSCSQVLRFNYSKGRTKKYPYYRCDSKEGCDLSPKSISRDVIHDDFIKLLKKAKIKVTMFIDSAMNAALSKEFGTKRVSKIFIGADALAKGGVINKIGSEVLAILAKKHKIPFYVVADSWKFSKNKIPIENRKLNEVWDKAPKKIKIKNPAFEFVPKKYLAGIITEYGLLSYNQFLKKVS